MKLRDYVEWELEIFRKECNFTASELQYFNLKAKDKSNVEIAMAMNVSESKVSDLARKVKSKMKRVI